MSRQRTRHVGRAVGRAGFTLIEMIVVIAIIISLAGVIVPVISGELEDAKQARAVADINRVATAVGQYIKDTGFLPTGNKGQEKYHWLYSYGDQPSSNDFASGPGTHLRRFLEMNDFGGNSWQGPYAGDIGPDPWGRAYVVNVQGYYKDSENVLVLCAGPNGAVDTHPSSTQAAGDDIVILID